MHELCYTPTQIKLVRGCILIMMGVTITQAITIRKQFKMMKQGRLRFKNLQEGTMYLLDVIEANNIDLTEFDVLALQAILQEDK